MIANLGAKKKYEDRQFQYQEVRTTHSGGAYVEYYINITE